jgi:hypothetical protein
LKTRTEYYPYFKKIVENLFDPMEMFQQVNKIDKIIVMINEHMYINDKAIIMQKLKDKVRNEILTAAASEFNQKGFQEASMRNIASKADITPGNIYRYFQNKETLLKAVVLPVMEEINQTLVECTDNKFNIFTKNQAFGFLAAEEIMI